MRDKLKIILLLTPAPSAVYKATRDDAILDTTRVAVLYFLPVLEVDPGSRVNDAAHEKILLYVVTRGTDARIRTMIHSRAKVNHIDAAFLRYCLATRGKLRNTSAGSPDRIDGVAPLCVQLSLALPVTVALQTMLLRGILGLNVDVVATGLGTNEAVCVSLQVTTPPISTSFGQAAPFVDTFVDFDYEAHLGSGRATTQIDRVLKAVGNFIVKGEALVAHDVACELKG